ncbi:hypothetical protein [Halococcus salsus]|uniref:hypothetical protein n=1 Tax=Halococcus salsus TaxID=2162894 RepID=UPI00135749C6|nr:hypothetical protein [Halococcus salsus]
MTPTTTHRHADDSMGDKAVLYCPECGHESPIDGDWNVDHDADSLVYTCPVCSTAVTTRPEQVLEA